jgi:mannose-6-phosphate isomerase-like protein (cupin superfamily)
MGKLVTFEQLPYRETAAGIRRAPITGAEVRHMSAEVIRMAPGAKLSESVPAGSDRYLFTLSGAVEVSAAGARHKMIEESFATVQEGEQIALENSGTGETTLISVLAPPAQPGEKLPGFNGGLAVAARKDVPVVDIPDQKKGRVYFAGKEAARTERAHAMIVQYVRDTVTGLHMHPDAESMFVFLSGKTRFTVNGADVVVGRGQATYFPAGDKHGLRVAEGDGVSFLEFHVPGAFTTVRD